MEDFDARDGVNPCVYAPYKGGLAGELSIFRNPWARHETKELAQGYIHVTGPPPISLVLPIVCLVGIDEIQDQCFLVPDLVTTGGRSLVLTTGQLQNISLEDPFLSQTPPGITDMPHA